MLDKYFSKPLGVDVTPIGISKPCLEIPLALGAAGLGMFLNGSSQESSNRTNLEATRMNNDTQKQLAREANELSMQQFQQNMKWLREQFYDTDQMKRTVESYLKAGVNPALAYGQPVGASSVGAPAESQFHVPQTEAGHVDPIQFGDGISESIGHATNAYYNNQLLNAQAENIREDSQTKRLNNMSHFAKTLGDLMEQSSRIALNKANKNLSDEQRIKLSAEEDELNWRIEQFKQSFNHQLQSIKKGNRLLDAQYDNTVVDTLNKSIDASLKPALASASIRLSNAQVNSLNEHLRLITPQIAQIYSQNGLTDAQAVGRYIENSLLRLDLKAKKELFGDWDTNGYTRLIKKISSMIGDSMFGQLRFSLPGK